MTAVAIVLITLIIVDSANDDHGDEARVAQPPTPATIAFGRVLNEDRRAVSLNIPSTTAESSLLMPGDWVDVQAPDHAGAVTTILESVQVLSVAQQQQRPDRPDSTVVTVDANHIVTLAVTPEGAQLLAVAQQSTTKLMLSRSPIALPDQSQ
jgi:Flp pilus assembly protein CpaB